MHKRTPRLPRANLALAVAAAGALAVLLAGAVMAEPPPAPSAAAAAKEAFQSRLAQQRQQDIAARPRAPKGVLGPPAPVQETRQASGTYETKQGWFSPSEFTISNVYHGPVQGDLYVFVYAGGKRVTPALEQATVPALRVYHEVSNGQGGFDVVLEGTYAMPGGTTAQARLHINTVTGTVLELQTATGSITYYDFARHTWA